MSSETQCPECNATIPVNPGYISWCECGWNLKPSFADDDEDGMVERIRIRIGDRMARDLFAKVSSAESLAPRMTFSKLLAYALAALVHLTSIALPVLGVWLLVSFWPNVVAICPLHDYLQNTL